MWRACSALVIGVLLACLPAPAAAAALERAKPVSRVDHLAAELRRDPVYVTDHAPRALPPDAAQRIRKAVARLGVPVFVAVTPTYLVDRYSTDDLVPLLHDSLGKPGVYIVADPAHTSLSAVQYGGATLPVRDAMRAATSELAGDAGAVAVIERFVEVALSGRAKERSDNAGPRPKSKVRIALDARDRSEREAARAEQVAFATGAVLSAVPLLLLLLWVRWWRHRRRPAEAAKTAQPRTTARKQKSKGGRQGKRR
ncbi:hypothetical protein HUT06_23630 [Actinomadura sp. NAK00032]|uniref:hypothetical protein n=1 Tax=Actinomadura sp. NAK00032 TaxID=2742128 RepID=UPI001591A1AE|nr:hypothetical protein [Actinomadura sp. NAK00032]QKW36646.1 hypothetical protein HUT06_23630 [Actinomadura sp. NAK00032]